MNQQLLDLEGEMTLIGETGDEDCHDMADKVLTKAITLLSKEMKSEDAKLCQSIVETFNNLDKWYA